MGRLISTGETPAKRRNAHMRSCAEVLRMLATRAVFDDEAKDMCAFLVFNMRGIYQTIDESAQAWNDRNYWKKAEALRQTWRWADLSSRELEELVRSGKWQLVPPLLIQLIPHFQQVNVQTITRTPDWWVGAYRALLRESDSTDTNGR